MNHFLDCEFIEDGKTIDLISIGLVAEDGREYYAISTEFTPANASDWVVENVLANLPPMQTGPAATSLKARSDERWEPEIISVNIEPANSSKVLLAQAWKPRTTIAQEILEFVGDDPDPKFWAEWGSCDWVVLCQLYGTMMELPKGWPMHVSDVVQYCEDHLRLSTDDWPASLETDGNHNALLGAQTVKARWEWCRRQDEIHNNL